MKKNKISTYLLYAIGEIILVVIGILIAIQLNQLQERRKLSKKEVESIKLLLRDLKVERDRMLYFVQELEAQENGIIKLLDAIDRKQPLDTVEKYVAASLAGYYFITYRPTYEGLIQNGNLDLIQDQSLRDFVVNHFEETQNYFVRLIDNEREMASILFDRMTMYYPRKLSKAGSWEYSKSTRSHQLELDPKILVDLGNSAASKNWLAHRIETYILVRSDSLSASLSNHLINIR